VYSIKQGLAAVVLLKILDNTIWLLFRNSGTYLSKI
jgi:hypothetical protein